MTRTRIRTRKRMSVKIRRDLVLSLLAAATMVILMRAVYLQVLHKDFLKGQGNERYLRVIEVPAHRGMIMDRHGDPLAVSSPVDSVWTDPDVILQHQHRVPKLARLLEQDGSAMLQDLQQRVREGRQFVYLRRHLSPDIAQWVMDLEIPGVYLQREYRRYYPTAEVSSHLLGFTNIDDVGQEGLELAYNKWLQGTPGSKRVLKDRFNRIVEDVDHIKAPQPGKQLILSIDRRIQYLAYRALKAAVLEHHASAASAVVLDVTSGEILAMVNQPAGNPNNSSHRTSAMLRNRAVTDVFEPGSAFKPFVVALGLETKAYRPGTLIDTSPGRLRVGRNTVRDTRNYGLIDVTRVISKSSNVGISKIALSLAREGIWQLYKDLGFGVQTNVGLIGEREGRLTHYTSWSDFEYVTHSFGYGVSVTALQLAQSYAVLAADGVKRPLSILRLEPTATKREQRILSSKTARTVRTMMERVVSIKGTAVRAAVPGFKVAGKTGTVHKVVNGRYARDRYLSLFAGMAPTNEPRLVMVVVVDEPKGDAYYGGQVASPVFSKVMAGALRLLNVTPDDVSEASFLAVAKSQGTSGL